MSLNKPLSGGIWNQKLWLLLGAAGFAVFLGFSLYLAVREKGGGNLPVEAFPAYAPKSSVTPTPDMVPETGAAAAPGRDIMLVKEGKFDSVIEPPEPVMDLLQEMSGGGKKKKAPVIFMNDSDLGRTVGMPSFSIKRGTSAARGVPSLSGDVTAEEHIVMPKAPVDFKVFLDAQTWNGFAASHRGKYPSVNFDRQMVVILVSLSEFPSGIFEIVSASREKDRILIRYRVNPFAMSAENPNASPDAYSAAAVERVDLPIVLEQVR